MKDKYGFEIPDRHNKMRVSSENPSGTWRDDEYEECIYEIIKIMEQRFPKSLKKQKSICISLPTYFSAYLMEKEIEKHEQGKIPYYMMAGEHMVNLYEGLEAPKKALLNQMKEVIRYLDDHPQLREDEIKDRMR